MSRIEWAKWIGILFLITVPLCLVENLNKFVHLNLLSLVSNASIILVTIYMLGMYSYNGSIIKEVDPSVTFPPVLKLSI